MGSVKLFRNKTARRIMLVALLFLTLFFSVRSAKIPRSVSYAVAKEIGPIESLEQLRNADAADIAGLSKYDSRDYGIVTPVRDQKDSNLCWAYASVSASEVSILRSGIDPNATKDNLSLSPESLGYSRWYRPTDPLGNTQAVYEQEGANWYTSSGNAAYCASMMSQWCGPIDKGKPANADPFENALYHLDNAVHIESTQISEIKLAIAKYGAVTFSYNNVREAEYYNPVRESGSASYPHACTVIGWDDSIPASKFSPNGASKDGGWLVKNSYISLPYFWLSYDVTTDSVYAFDFTSNKTHDNNYFYDYSLTDHLNYTLKVKKACEIYEAKTGTNERAEYLNAVNIGFIGKNVTAKVDIYVDPKDATNPESGKRAGGGEAIFDHGGFRTIYLDEPVVLEKGTKFACVVSVSNANDSVVICNMLGKTGSNAFIYKNYWQSANNYTPRIKAFTCLNPIATHVHDLVSFEEKAATCTTDGMLAHNRCSGCGKSFVNGAKKSEEELKISATGHACGEWTVVVSPTCSTTGGKKRTCTRCGYEESEAIAISPDAHIYGEWIDEVTATVSATGTKGHKDCSVCEKHFDKNNNEMTDIVIPKIYEEPVITIIVENGSINGTTANSVRVDINESVTVVAAEIDGKTFKGWSVDGGKTIVNALLTYTFKATSDSTLTAVYEDATTIPEEDDATMPENKPSAEAIAGISIGSVGGALIIVYVICYFTLYRKGVGAKNKAIDILYYPMNAVFGKKK